MIIFIDTSAFYALADRTDKHASRAAAFYEKRLRTDRLVATDAVLLESWRLMRDKLGWDAAYRFWSGIKRSPVQIIYLDESDLEIGFKTLEGYADQELSAVDATSFAVMERHRIIDVFTFDKDFLLYRYGPRNERSFTRWP